jgi:hypothetical protein
MISSHADLFNTGRITMESGELPLKQLSGGLGVLLDACDWARGSGIDPWQFAVSIERLRQAGLSDTHLSWLLCNGHLQHAREFTPPCDDERTFRPAGRLNFGKRSCFVLTDAGVRFARPICQKHHASSDPSAERPVLVSPSPDGSILRSPLWDRERRRLTLNGEVLMELSTRARNQLQILDTFHEEAWPPQIDDPLPGASGVDAKRRLRGAIEKLNGNVRIPRIRFSGDGSGESICWKLTGAPRVRGDDEAALVALPACGIH